VVTVTVTAADPLAEAIFAGVTVQVLSGGAPVQAPNVISAGKVVAGDCGATSRVKTAVCPARMVNGPVELVTSKSKTAAEKSIPTVCVSGVAPPLVAKILKL
jgi:hypothetical protein